MNIWPAVFLFVSLTTCASSNFGVWSTSCSNEEGFAINIESKSNPLIVNDNQIVINIHAKETHKNKIDIFYDGTADLGGGE